MSGAWWSTAILALGNLAYLLPAWTALRLRLYTRAFVLFFIVFQSGFYHLCKGDWRNAPGTPGACVVLTFKQYHDMDFFAAQLIMVIVGLYFVSFRPVASRATGRVVKPSLYWLERWLIYGYGLAIIVSVMLVPQDFTTLLPLTVSLLITIGVGWIYCLARYGERPRFKPQRLALAVALALTSVGMFAAEFALPHRYYHLTHSLWHPLGAAGIHFLWGSRDTSAERDYSYLRFGYVRPGKNEPFSSANHLDKRSWTCSLCGCGDDPTYGDYECARSTTDSPPHLIF